MKIHQICAVKHITSTRFATLTEVSDLWQRGTIYKLSCKYTTQLGQDGLESIVTRLLAGGLRNLGLILGTSKGSLL